MSRALIEITRDLITASEDYEIFDDELVKEKCMILSRNVLKREWYPVFIWRDGW